MLSYSDKTGILPGEAGSMSHTDHEVAFVSHEVAVIFDLQNGISFTGSQSAELHKILKALRWAVALILQMYGQTVNAVPLAQAGAKAKLFIYIVIIWIFLLSQNFRNVSI